jgi:hypothetical protein
MLKRYLVLQDLAAVDEWATREPAGRRVKDAAEDSGQAYGPFWESVRRLWPPDFGSETGLDHAMKAWAKGRRDFAERSPFIVNIRLRHPECRVLPF